ncbi:MAG TPA: type II toxin-antitoxin system PemK/MazF family toxin, partial [Acetobacteraceae bacterium]|nr:type II toxin-antitoxin system PemK/MazF family toxin [Acetobacteraceae bacterium]
MYPIPRLDRVKRGDLVTVASSGDFGKPRPALIIHVDACADHPSLTILALTSELYDAPGLRILIEPREVTGL